MTSLLELSDALQQLVSRVSPAVVGVEQGRGAGTGVVVASDGFLLTNHHVAGSGKALGSASPGAKPPGASWWARTPPPISPS